MMAGLREIAAKSQLPPAGNQTGVGNASLDAIAEMFEGYTDLPVKNATGLSGNFSCTVRWSRDGFRDAVEDQLGLVLTRSNEKLDVLVIDRALKAPSEN
jgi:uncharacterized protein (TIGR03435 family)